MNILIIYSLIACGNLANSQNSDVTSAGDSQSGLDFNTHFKKFSEDESYQISHIEFPLKIISYDIFTNAETIYLGKGEWEYYNYLLDSMAIDNEYDKYVPLFEKQSDSEYLYIQKGVDNGIRVEYHFKYVNNIWLLVKLVDKST